MNEIRNARHRIIIKRKRAQLSASPFSLFAKPDCLNSGKFTDHLEYSPPRTRCRVFVYRCGDGFLTQTFDFEQYPTSLTFQSIYDKHAPHQMITIRWVLPMYGEKSRAICIHNVAAGKSVCLPRIEKCMFICCRILAHGVTLSPLARKSVNSPSFPQLIDHIPSIKQSQQKQSMPS